MKKVWGIVFGVMILTLALLPEKQEAISADAAAEMPEQPNYVALTFDDGPNREPTTQLLDGLRDRGVNVTFFLVGEQIAGNEELVLRMKEEGHQIGNHTWSHKSLQGVNDESFWQEVGRTQTLLEEILGPGSYWLRPPYGQISQTRMKQVGVPMVKWSVDPRDWESRNTEKVLQAILREVKPGSIILLHDIYPTSVQAALMAVDQLQEDGYVFVTVEELLALSGIEVQPGIMYRAAEGQITSKGTA